MDPQATWNELLACHADGRADDAREAAAALLAWLDQGGFAPSTLDCLPRDDSLHRVVAVAVCRRLLNPVG
jgi:hypothetical protein